MYRLFLQGRDRVLLCIRRGLPLGFQEPSDSRKNVTAWSLYIRWHTEPHRNTSRPSQECARRKQNGPNKLTDQNKEEEKDNQDAKHLCFTAKGVSLWVLDRGIEVRRSRRNLPSS